MFRVTIPWSTKSTLWCGPLTNNEETAAELASDPIGPFEFLIYDGSN